MGRRLAAALTLLLATSTAYAQTDDAPPPELDTDDGGRRAIRGAPVLSVPPDPKLEAQRKFEQEALTEEKIEEEAAILPKKITAETKPEEVRPDLDWLKGLKTGDIPVRWDPRVIKYLEFYKNDPRGRALMTAWLREQGRFRDLILDALRRHELPEDLLYLSMIESSYDPRELSRVGASGLWQFMPAGGKIYGLEQNYWVDERNDPIKSTEAAMLYWRDLIDRFGNWHLTLAAFNAGYGAALKSMAKYNTNDFWHLLELEGGLPWESSVYVPKALAAMTVGHNRDVFNFDTLVEAEPFAFDEVTLHKSTKLATIAKHLGVTEQVISDLNPELKRNRTPADVTEYKLRIPKGSKAKLLEKMRELKAEWDTEETYIVRHGERFEDVAKTHNLSPRSLRELNGCVDVGELRGGMAIVVPVVPDEVKTRLRAEAEADLYRSEVTPGGPDDPMLVPVPNKDFTVPGKKRVFYRVVIGDTLDGVADAFGVKKSTLVRWNGLDEDTNIAARMVLVVWVDEQFDAAARNIALLDDARLMVVTSGSAEHLDIVEGRKGRVRKTLVAKKGDTLESLGKPYGLSKYDVARINRRGYTTDLQPGEQIVVYQIVDKKKAAAAGVKNTVHKNKPKFVKKKGGKGKKLAAKTKGKKGK